MPKPDGFTATDGFYLGGGALIVAAMAYWLIRRPRRKPRAAR